VNGVKSDLIPGGIFFAGLLKDKTVCLNFFTGGHHLTVVL